MYRYWIVLLMLLMVSCTSTDESDAPANGAGECAAPEPEQPVARLGKLEDPDAPEQTRAIEAIETITGLTFKQRVPVYVYTPEELAEEIKGWGDDGFTPENILGFYKWSTKAFYLVPEAAGNKRAYGLRIHEAVHALQDQHYDLAKLHAEPETSDADWALLALIEGEAVQVMVDALIEKQPHVAFISKARAPEGSTDPAAYRNVYVYAHGTQFVEALKKVDGYKTVDGAFRDLPVSTEQILHPEKYTGKRDLPDEITLDMKALKEALPGWKLSEPDRLGEFEMRMVWVQQEQTVMQAESIAAGWGGDAQVVATKGETELKLWVTTWDTRDDAREFFEALDHLPDGLGVVWNEDVDPLTVYLVRGNMEPDYAFNTPIFSALRRAKIVHDPK
ncbi:MAG: hypothetical protein K8I27_15360 [Planctomycetes bacterium]|nr:hypothetical protein [Planctomycetota bacterium]